MAVVDRTKDSLLSLNAEASHETVKSPEGAADASGPREGSTKYLTTPKMAPESYGLLNEIGSLTLEIRQLRKEIQALASALQGLQPSSEAEVIVLETMSREEAKGKIKSLFQKTEGALYYSDLAKALNMDLRTVVEICEELEKEGLIRFED